VGDQIGWQNWTAIYLSSGVLANLTVMSYNVLRRDFIYIGLGASGAVNGITSAYCAIEPSRTFKIPYGGEYEVTSQQLLLAVGALVAFPLLRHGFKNKREVDDLNHIAGFLAGMVSGWMLRREKPHPDEAKGEEKAS
jgi:membrane associated rhomboid family serine protease